ncbi:tyrosine-type recombinase/integrase [Amedibacillus sp. YH-ame10]
MSYKYKRFGDVCELWLAYKSIGVKESTFAIYSRIVHKKILPVIGNIQIEELDLEVIMDFIKRMEVETELSSKSIMDITIVLKGIIKYAFQLHLTDIPVNMIPLPKVQNSKIEIIKQRDMQKIIHFISMRCLPRDIALLISIYTGTRLGEVCALMWSDIDFDRGIISIERTVQRISYGAETRLVIQTAKTKNSIRRVPFQGCLESILFRLKTEDDVYIATGTQKVLEPRLLQMHFKKTLLDLDITNVKYHTLRHTFASRCVQCNVDVKSLSEVLGHSSVNITLNKYVHTSIDEQRRQLEKLTF